jgi:hypothetical protein
VELNADAELEVVHGHKQMDRGRGGRQERKVQAGARSGWRAARGIDVRGVRRGDT